MQLAEILSAISGPDLGSGVTGGVTHAVAPVPPDGPDGAGWDYLPLLRMQQRFADRGLTLAVIETGFPWLHRGKLGLPGADEEIARCQILIRNLGAIGVPWCAGTSWRSLTGPAPRRLFHRVAAHWSLATITR